MAGARAERSSITAGLVLHIAVADAGALGALRFVNGMDYQAFIIEQAMSRRNQSSQR